jgi:hypothetical protein
VVIEPPDTDPAQAGQVPLVFVPVPEPKTSKNRVHLDVASTSDDHKAALVARLEGLGAHQVDIGQPDDVSWVVMADPEGNEFCVVSHLGSVGKDPASAFAGIGPVAAVVFDCMDPEAIAAFWAAAIGWRVLGRDDQGSGSATTEAAAPISTCTGSASPRPPSCGCTWTSHPSPTTTIPPRLCVSALSAPSRSTSAKATSAGPSLPTPRATSSASSPLADRTDGARPTMPGLLVPQRPAAAAPSWHQVGLPKVRPALPAQLQLGCLPAAATGSSAASGGSSSSAESPPATTNVPVTTWPGHPGHCRHLAMTHCRHALA